MKTVVWKMHEVDIFIRSLKSKEAISSESQIIDG